MACSNCGSKLLNRNPSAKRPCTCDKPSCRLCLLFKNNPRYAALWGDAEQPLQISCGANGIGDILLCACACRGARNRWPNKPIFFYGKQENWQWLQLFDVGYTGLYPIGNVEAVNLNAGYAKECLTKSVQRRVDRYADTIGVEAALPALKNREALKDAGNRYAGVVALCPFSVYNNRNYSVEGWISAERMLLHAGYRVCVIHNNSADCVRFTGEKIISKTPAEIVSIMLNCACVVGVDSGLCHLSSMIGVPTVVLTGPSDAEKVFFAPVREVKSKVWCHGCYWQAPYSAVCDRACAALYAIPPEAILAAVDSEVLPRIADRSISGPGELSALRDQLIAVQGLQGDTAELGVYRGGTSRLILRYSPQVHHAFDTFNGEPLDTAEQHHSGGNFADTSLEEVQRYLDSPRVRYHVGKFPDVAPADDTRYRLAHFDADSGSACGAFLDYFAPRMVQGGRMVISDYGYVHTPNVAQEVHKRYKDVIKVSEYSAVIVC